MIEDYNSSITMNLNMKAIENIADEPLNMLWNLERDDTTKKRYGKENGEVKVKEHENEFS